MPLSIWELISFNWKIYPIATNIKFPFWKSCRINKIYRNTDLIDQTSNTYYIDTTIEPNSEYVYNISCLNSVGESDFSEGISIKSWPNDDDVLVTKIISLYPNPIYRPGFSSFNLVVDYGSNIKNSFKLIYGYNSADNIIN